MKYRIERWSYNVCTDAVETDSWDIIQDIIKTKKFSEDSDNGECIFEVFADGEEVKNPVGPEPKEPLIKDEKIRKAVRAWAEAVGVNKVIYEDSGWHFEYFRTVPDEYDHAVDIDFWHKIDADLRSGTSYTIAELCGEEEE